MRPLTSIVLIAALVCLAPASVMAEETGRTDGPEGTEYGKGGNPFGTRLGRVYAGASFGSGFFSLQGAGRKTGFLYGVDLGYEMDEWIGLQAGYAYLADRDMSIYSLGTRLCYPWERFVYSISIQAGLYAPDLGERNFGLAPGAGIDILVHDRVRIGLGYKHDFVFTDGRTTEMDRVHAGLKFSF